MPTQLTVADTTNPISADTFNTYEQTCDTVADLIGFIGVTGMQVYLRGYTSPGDGGQGPFYWNATGTSPDDAGITTVIPSGSSVGNGEWTRLSIALTGGTVSGNLAVTGSFAVNGVTTLAALSAGATSLGTTTITGTASATDFSGSGASLTAVKGSQLAGTNTNDNATAGNVGEYIESRITAGATVALTTNVAVNVTSIALSPGDWDVRLQGYFNGDATTTVQYAYVSISSASATIQDNGLGGVGNSDAGTPFAAGSIIPCSVAPLRVSLSTGATYYLVAQAGFAVSTCGAFGIISARRVR